MSSGGAEPIVVSAGPASTEARDFYLAHSGGHFSSPTRSALARCLFCSQEPRCTLSPLAGRPFLTVTVNRSETAPRAAQKSTRAARILTLSFVGRPSSGFDPASQNDHLVS
jgi:hypothetical protein